MSCSDKMHSKKLDIVADVDEPKKKSKRRKKIIIISNEDNKIKDMKQEINKKRKELEELTMCLKKKQVFVDKKKK